MQVKLYGLIGYPLEHSFSENFFQEKFLREGIKDSIYQNIEINNLNQFIESIKSNNEALKNLQGFNITMPYKEEIITCLDTLSNEAKEIGAVNIVKINRDRGNIVLEGYNSDMVGFEQSLFEHINKEDKKNIKALVLGTGGASRAVRYVLNKYNIDYTFVSRRENFMANSLTYAKLNSSIIKSSKLIINTTPLGMLPYLDLMPEIDYDSLDREHILFDLIYNPEETHFLRMGRLKGSKTINGLDMLCYQAIEGWRIWNNE